MNKLRMVRHAGRPKADVAAADAVTQVVVEAIDAAGFDDGYVARRAGIGRNELSRWRHGHASPSAASLAAAAQACGFEVFIRDCAKETKA